MGTGINGPSHTIAQLDYIIANFQSIRNKHYRQSFEIKMTLLVKKPENASLKWNYSISYSAGHIFLYVG